MINEITNGITSFTKRVLLGLLLFISSFFVLFWNEGGPDISEIAAESIEIQNIENIDKNIINKQFISIAGRLQTSEELEDIFLKKDNYVQINRIVETYKATNTPNKNTTEKIKRTWVKNIKNLQEIEDYYKDQTLNSLTQTANFVTISDYTISIDNLDLPEAENLILTKNNSTETNNIILLNQKYLFKGHGTLQQPKTGDIRIHYTVIKSPSILFTLFGKIDTVNKIISPYYYDENESLYRIFNKNREESIIELKKEDLTVSWLFRIVGFALMWAGLLFFVAPLAELIKSIPFISEIGTIGIIITTGLISAILSAITIFISVIVHNIILLVIGIVLIVTGAIFYIRNKNDKSHKNLIA